MKKILMLSMIVLFSVSCTDGFWGKVSSYGESRNIECYSGTKLIYSGASTGKIASEAQSDGYYFTEKGTDKLMEVSGNCVIGK